MDRFARVLQELLRWAPQLAPEIDRVERFLSSGDRGDLQQIAAASATHWAGLLADRLGHPLALGPADERVLDALLWGDQLRLISLWLARSIRSEKPGEDVHAAVHGRLLARGVPESVLLGETVAQVPLVTGHRQPTSAGRYVLSHSDLALAEAGASAAEAGRAQMAILFLAAAPERALPHVERAVSAAPSLWLCQELCTLGGAAFETQAVRLFRALGAPGERFQAGLAVDRAYRGRYAGEVLPLARQVLAGDARYLHPDAAGWLAGALGEEAVPELEAYFRRPAGGKADAWLEAYRRQALAAVVEALGPAAAPLVSAALGNGDRATHLQAAGHLAELGMLPDARPAIQEGLAQPHWVGRYALLAARADLQTFAPRLWEMLADRSKLIRAGAAAALARYDPDAVSRAGALLSDERRDVRWGAALVLAGAGTPDAVAPLKPLAGGEPDADVRDGVCRALRAAGVRVEELLAEYGAANLEAIRARAAGVRGLPARWLDEAKLPTLRFADGRPLERQDVRFLLYRQARQKEPILDPEALPLTLLMDRQASGDFALALLESLLASGVGKEGAWALLIAGLLGDARVITRLSACVRAWADEFELKLGQWGIEALALNGSDAALLAVDAIANRYREHPRTKYRRIGDMAQAATERAAERLGVTLEELGDRIVPSLGFEAGRPRVIPCGKRTLHASIGMKLKLSLADAATGKPVASLPKSAPPEVQAEFKGLAGLLRDVAKVQTARLEGLMVGRRRWSGARWKELFLGHPVLRPFAVRLVWAAYADGRPAAAAGRPAATFRALEDGSLTGAGDDAYLLPDDAAVGIAHPLDLEEQVLAAWRAHLADYEIEPPFAQLDRPVVCLPDEGRGRRSYGAFAGLGAHALALRSRAERLGWQRGPQTGDREIAGYRKRFAGAGIDAFVELDGMPLFPDNESRAAAGRLLFVPAGTDLFPDGAPLREDDPALLALGDLPPVVFSEAAAGVRQMLGDG